MKKLLTFFCFLILASCSKEVEISFDQLVYRQGKYYEVNSKEPFTGVGVDYHDIDDNDDNDVLWRKETFKDGKNHGLFERYYKNGQIDYKGNYINGKRDALWEFYFENGQLRTKGLYKDGIRESKWVHYLENGRYERSETFKNGKSAYSECWDKRYQLWKDDIITFNDIHDGCVRVE